MQPKTASSDRELHFATLTLPHPPSQIGWVHARPNKGNAANPPLPQAALRVCRRLQTEHNLLAAPLHDDGGSFYVMYTTSPSTKLQSVSSYGHLIQILSEKLDCVVLDSSAETDEGVPAVVAECALLLAMRVHLALRGWYGVGTSTFVRSPVQDAFPPASDVSTLVDAVELECQLGGDGSVCLSAEGSVRRMTPLKLSTLTMDAFPMDDGDLEKETEHVLSSCAVLPSLNGGGIKCVAESLGALPSHKSSLLSSEGDFRKYWSETYGYKLPAKIEGWAMVQVGANSLHAMTYPLCCLLASDLTLNPAHSRRRKADIVRSLLTELQDITIGLRKGSGSLLQFQGQLMTPHYATIAWAKSSDLMAMKDRPNVMVGAAPAPSTSAVRFERQPAQEPIPPKSDRPLPQQVTTAAVPAVRPTGCRLGMKRAKPMDASTIAAKGTVQERITKRPRSSSAEVDASKSADVQALAMSDNLSELSVAQLRAFCKEKGLGMPRKKDDLIASIKKHFGINGTKEE